MYTPLPSTLFPASLKNFVHNSLQLFVNLSSRGTSLPLGWNFNRKCGQENIGHIGSLLLYTLEAAACYARLLLAPAEGFDQGFFCPSGRPFL